ncbi:MAG TPA: vanadium-dependent haloperoxidase [Candidatus Udaeobacter sp.]|nr:vanadium-dependent haloperoxidase [Candidatus Udaeobacter sp.]
MNPLTQFKRILILPILIELTLVALAAPASATLPPGNTVQQWNKIAEDTVVGSGAFQTEGLIYMSYTSAAVYDAAVAIDGGFEPYGPAITAPPGASVDCAVIEAAYRTLVNYFPLQAVTLGALYAEALSNFGGCTGDGGGGTLVGQTAATNIITLRTGDGRMTPIGTTSSFPTLPPGPGVWRLTPPFQSPQTPWVGNVRRFILHSVDQFLPDPPPSLQSPEWVEAFNEVKVYGPATGSTRTAEQTFIAKFWSANVIRQYNRAGRDIVDARGLGLLETARLAAMINLVGADAQMSNLHAKYHYLFWRPVTAINGSLDPTAVTNDGFGPVPGYNDGNPATVEQAGWRPLLTTPNHPEYPSAHGTLTSAMAEVFRALLGTNHIDLDIHGFDPAGPAGNLNAVRHFDTASDLRSEIINARLWAGLHYRLSTVAGIVLGRQVAKFDLKHAFQPVE